MSDDRPQRPKSKSRLAIDGLDPPLAHQGAFFGAVALDPMRQKHPDRARLVPGQEVLRALDPGVVAAQGPDPPAHSRYRPASALIDHGEGVPAEQLPEQELGGGPRD